MTSKDKDKQSATVITPLHLLQTLTRTLNEHLSDACREAEEDARKAMEKLTRQHTRLQEKLAEAEEKLAHRKSSGADRKAIEKSEQKIASLLQGLNELQDARTSAEAYTRQLQSDVRQTLRIARGLERIENQADLAIDKRNSPKPPRQPANRSRKPRGRKPAAVSTDEHKARPGTDAGNNA